MNAKNVSATLCVGQAELDTAIDTSGSEQSRVERIRSAARELKCQPRVDPFFA